jgi:hypothetical protein
VSSSLVSREFSNVAAVSESLDMLFQSRLHRRIHIAKYVSTAKGILIFMISYSEKRRGHIIVGHKSKKNVNSYIPKDFMGSLKLLLRP